MGANDKIVTSTVTLGSFLKGDKEEKKNNQVAPELFNPGFAPNPEEGGADDRDPELIPTEGIQDLKKSSREILSKFAASNQKDNQRYHSSIDSTDDAPGYGREDVIPLTTGENVFLPLNEDSEGSLADEADNFRSLSGGITVNAKLGSFFGAKMTTHFDKTAKGIPGTVASKITHDSEGNLESTEFTKSIEEVLDESNRFSPNFDTSPYIKNKNTTDEREIYSKGMWSVQTGHTNKNQVIQKGFGKYNKDAPHLSVTDLKEMAMHTMLAAGGHASDLGSWDITLAMIPSRVQLGTGKVDASLLRIKNTDGASGKKFSKEAIAGALGIPIDDASIGILANSAGADDIIMVQRDGSWFGIGPAGPIDGLSAPKNANTFGQMNTYVEPFDGSLPLGMMMVVLTGMLLIVILAETISFLLKAVSSESEFTPLNPNHPSSLAMGRNEKRTIIDHKKVGYGLSISKWLKRNLGIPKTGNDFGLSVTKGLNAFYDVGDANSTSTPAAEVLAASANISMAPGYYATVTKQIIRDMNEISTAIAMLGAAATPLGGFTALFNAIRALFGFSSFKFILRMAQLGDISLRHDSSLLRGQRAHGGALVTKYEDDVRNFKWVHPGNRMSSRSRFNTDHTSNASPLSLHTFASALLPNIASEIVTRSGINVDENKYDGAPEMLAAGTNWITRKESEPRISKDTVLAIENILNQEYMPFYIHDIRTNEIIAMPAFLSSISDSFSVEYTDSHGYGRTDPVKTYNKTTRSIDISFKLAAMNDSDHEYMWYIINKLTSMLYPQRSEGKLRKYDNGKKWFTQPFSQVPTASPMVRIKVGDLISSNYHIKNFQRMFGADPSGNSSTFKVGDDSARAAAEALKIAKQIVTLEFREKLKIPSPVGAIISIPISIDLGASLEVDWEGGASAPWWNEKGQLLLGGEHLAHQSIGLAEKLDFNIIAIVAGDIDDDVATSFEVEPVGSAKKVLEAYGKERWPDRSVIAASVILFDHESSKIHPRGAEFDKAVEEEIKDYDLSSTTIKEMNEFFDPASNALVRSFESTRGRGLAGFITQMSLSYDGAMWETSKTGNKAPRSVDVQLTFAPIHDLPLGLDSDGHIIAPSHPAGLSHTDPYGLTDNS